METKVVKFEIGKLLAVVVVVLAIVAGAAAYLNSSYFKGLIILQRPATTFAEAVNGFTVDLNNNVDFNIAKSDFRTDINTLVKSGVINASTSTVDSVFTYLNTFSSKTSTVVAANNLIVASGGNFSGYQKTLAYQLIKEKITSDVANIKSGTNLSTSVSSLSTDVAEAQLNQGVSSVNVTLTSDIANRAVQKGESATMNTALDKLNNSISGGSTSPDTAATTFNSDVKSIVNKIAKNEISAKLIAVSADLAAGGNNQSSLLGELNLVLSDSIYFATPLPVNRDRIIALVKLSKNSELKTYFDIANKDLIGGTDRVLVITNLNNSISKLAAGYKVP